MQIIYVFGRENLRRRWYAEPQRGVWGDVSPCDWDAYGVRFDTEHNLGERPQYESVSTSSGTS